MSQFPEECHVKGCPCHEFALKRPQKALEDSVMEFHLPSLKTSPTDRQVAKTPLPATTSTFEDDWNHAPSGRRRRVEQEDALWWYVAGGRAKEAELMETFNEDLKEILRIARLRIPALIATGDNDLQLRANRS